MSYMHSGRVSEEQSGLFSLRDACENDRRYLDSYTYAEGMDYLPSLENVRVAVNAQDEPVGFIRVSVGENGIARVNPIVVHESWRGFGVGRALIDEAQAVYGELRLVSRGSSKPFYDALGFECCDWDLIENDVIEDCDGCPLIDECNPQPMSRRLENQFSS